MGWGKEWHRGTVRLHTRDCIGLPGALPGPPEPVGSPPGGRPGGDSSGSGAPGGAPGSPIQSLVWSLTVPRGHFLSKPILSKEHLIGALDYMTLVRCLIFVD